MSEIKALTLWQPWATLIALGAKQVETRSWSTSYRGPLVIHAAKRPVKHEEITAPIAQALNEHGLEPDALPLGAVLCLCKLTDVERVETLKPRLWSGEVAFGNYAPGRYGWLLELVKCAPSPIPVAGKQGLWTWQYGKAVGS